MKQVKAVFLWRNEMFFKKEKKRRFFSRTLFKFQIFSFGIGSFLIGRSLRGVFRVVLIAHDCRRHKNIESSSPVCPDPTNLAPRLRRGVKAPSWGGVPAGFDLWLSASHFWSRQEEKLQATVEISSTFYRFVSLRGNFCPLGVRGGRLWVERWETAFCSWIKRFHKNQLSELLITDETFTLKNLKNCLFLITSVSFISKQSWLLVNKNTVLWF